MDDFEIQKNAIPQVSGDEIEGVVSAITLYIQEIYSFEKPTTREELRTITGILDTIFPISFEREGLDTSFRIPKSTLCNQVDSFWVMRSNLEKINPEFLSSLTMDCRLATFVLSSILNSFGIENNVVLFKDNSHHPHLIIDLGDEEGIFRYSKIPEKHALLPVRFYDNIGDHLDDLKNMGHKVFKTNLHAIKCLDIHYLVNEYGYVPKQEELIFLI